MKLPKYITYFLLSISLITTSVVAQTFESFTDDVTVTATITEDINSTIEVSPSNVEIFERAIVTITIRESNNNPLSGHYIELVAPGLVFTQPIQASNSQGKIWVQVYSPNTGTYSITANDITDPSLTIDIIDSDTLYVTPVQTPFLLEEPVYTKGLTNTLFWNSIGSGYNYLIQVSESSIFSTLKDSSGWISGTMFEFQNLENEKMYFYRVKARNSSGGESSWSNIVYSVQDSVGPVITLLSVGDIGDNNTVNWVSSFEVDITYTVTDNLSLSTVSFFCVKRNGTEYPCGDTTSNGSTYTTSIRLNELEKDGVAYLFSEYSFCVNAKDSVDNQTDLCDIPLNIPIWSSPEEPEEPGEEEKPPGTIPTYVGRVIKDVVDTGKALLDDLFGNMGNYELEDINTTTTIATITVGLGTLLGGLLYIPIYLFELLMSLLSWLGLRKQGKLSGFVYDSGSKEPIAQAIVRVYNEERKLVWTDVTGSRGYFDLALDDGTYKIEVSSRDHVFPSKLIFGKADYPLENVYHGEEFVVKDSIIPEFSIPLDAVELSWLRKIFITLKSRTRLLSKILSFILFLFGLIFSIYTYYINSNVFNLIMRIRGIQKSP